jgi:hypothetical protein
MALAFLIFVVALLLTQSFWFALIVGGIMYVYTLPKTPRRW